ncbi:hypothetical protein [Methanolobus sp.]|uniref:hypothetical protein n=1 Tax=Methanolobus sp. TaxID=1874737 RepID=UPI0025F05C3A|nr:hypothetical protein [Methanolobus sp.]
MSKKDLESIDELNLEAKEIIDLSKKFFLSVPIENKRQVISTGNHIYSLDGDINKNPTTYSNYYTWGKLSMEMLTLQKEILDKYASWYENSKPLIEVYNPSWRNAFNEYNKIINRHINLSDQTIEVNNEKIYQVFMNCFRYQKNMVDPITDIIQSQYIFFINKNKINQAFRIASKVAKKQWQYIIALLIFIALLADAINGWSVIAAFINTTLT